MGSLSRQTAVYLCAQALSAIVVSRTLICLADVPPSQTKSCLQTPHCMFNSSYYVKPAGGMPLSGNATACADSACAHFYTQQKVELVDKLCCVVQIGYVIQTTHSRPLWRSWFACRTAFSVIHQLQVRHSGTHRCCTHTCRSLEHIQSSTLPTCGQMYSRCVCYTFVH